MGRRVDIDDLIDSTEVATILGLARSESISLYRSRYPDFPAPVLDLGRGRPMLWLRQDIERWARARRSR